MPFIPFVDAIEHYKRLYKDAVRLNNKHLRAMYLRRILKNYRAMRGIDKLWDKNTMSVRELHKHRFFIFL